MINDNEHNGIEDKVMQAIRESGFNHSIIFMVQSEEINDKMSISAMAACAGDLDILHNCLAKLFEKDDKMYELFADAMESARKERVKNNPSIN